MTSPSSVRSPWSAFKRIKVRPAPTFQILNANFSTSSPRLQSNSIDETSHHAPIVEQLRALRPQDRIRNELIDLANERQIPLPPQLQTPPSTLRLPRSVQALYLQPLRRPVTHGVPVANLQLRSFSVRNLEFVADFAVRAAYYLNLPAKGPIPLPRITERWTVPRSNFIYKKSQENFERVTVRRLVQVLDGHPEVVQRWLAFVRKWAWYGVGMKADVFEFEDLQVGKRMDAADRAVTTGIDGVKWELFGRRRGENEQVAIEKQLEKQGLEIQFPAERKNME